MRRVLLSIFAVPVCVGVCAVARAQTSQPADAASGEAPAPPPRVAPPPAPSVDPWTAAVRALVASLTSADDAGVLADALPAAAAIRRFGADEPQDRDALHRATAGAAVVSVLSYTNGPSTVATDLALDIRESAFLPESIRNHFNIEGETAVRRANETAAQWVNGALQPGVQQPVALVALWHPSRGTMTFVLLKGRETAAGEHRVTYVVYGDVGHIVG